MAFKEINKVKNSINTFATTRQYTDMGSELINISFTFLCNRRIYVYKHFTTQHQKL